MKLSICIPTYNRGKFIGHLLESILAQVREGVEIVISDNASEDNTEKLVGQFQHRYPQIIYDRSPINFGPDRNYLRVVSLARGEFCWLMGSDDQLEPGAIDRVLELLSQHKNLSGISVNLKGYNLQMTKRVNMTPFFYDRDIYFTDWQECFRTLFIYFGYLSGQIVRKAYWDEVLKDYPVEKFFNAYVHVFILGKLIQKHLNWMYCNQQCVGWRSGNDFFLLEGQYKRCALDLGYIDILNEISDSDTKQYIVNNLIKGHFKIHIKTALFHQKSKIELIKMKQLYRREFRHMPFFWRYLAPWVFVPQSLLRLFRFLHQKSTKQLKRAFQLRFCKSDLIFDP